MRFFLVSMFSLLIFAASAYASYQYGVFSENTIAFSGFELYLEPSTLSTVVCSIPPGTEIQIYYKTENTSTENNYDTDWYKISCNTPGGIKSGFCPAGNFALTYQTLSDGSIFTFGITGYSSDINKFEGIGRIISDGLVFTETEITPPSDIWGSSSTFIYNVDSRLYDVQGYTDVIDIPIVSFTYEACGYENRDIPLFWTGDLLVSAPHTSSVYEAMVFHWFENHIFASDSLGRENTLIIYTLSEQWDDQLEDYVVSSETDRSIVWIDKEFQEIED